VTGPGSENASWKKHHDTTLGLYGFGLDIEAGMIQFERE